MLVRSVIYGVGFDFMHPFQIKNTTTRWCFCFILDNKIIRITC